MSTIGFQGRSLWAITSYFNPAAYRRRLANFRQFRARLKVPLVAVELANGPDFELARADADILVQIRSPDVMWQKERLLNLALRSLPDSCRTVVSLDCDVMFATDDWADRVEEALRRVVILQPYRHVYDLPRDFTLGEPPPAGLRRRQSVTSAMAAGVPAAACLGEFAPDGTFAYSRGIAWAARRELLDRHHFYDVRILGGGDRALSGAVFGYFDAMRHSGDPLYLKWAVPFHKAVGTDVGAMDGDVYHLWHGELKNRNYHDRMKILERFAFDATKDIALANNGCWRWNSDKPELHECVRGYFASRREDG
jgi:hypothetical protein